jgi:hypothetical protein
VEPRDLINQVNRSIEDAKQELIKITGVFWVLEMDPSSGYGLTLDGFPIYLSRLGWTTRIDIAKKFLTKEDAEYYMHRVDPILIGIAKPMEHAYF